MEDVCEVKDFSFPAEEQRVLELWARLDAFHEQLRRTEGGEEFIFYDGPPFATGPPHYGHILAGTIKDVVTRHQSMRGRHVMRRFGWDCHGLPVEFEIDKLLGITNRQQVIDLGIGKYNETCRGIVTKYVAEWEAVVTRTGRWIDFKADYKTMDINFMESVWWVFGQLWDKDLVYKGFKVMPYSTGCKTALSNFEAALDYRTVPDPAVMVSFPIVGDADNAALVAWTTTPWTLPSNLALCVNANLVYAKVKDRSNGTVYMVAESRLGQLPVKAKASGKKQAPSKGSNAEGVQGGLDTESYELLAKIPGSSLVGLKYTPLFDFFLELQDNAFRVIADNYVTDNSGTGVVHCAPAFGEDDHRVCLSAGIIEASGLVVAVDDDGHFIEKISQFKGRHVKEADKDIINAVKDKGRLVSKGSIEHSYPYCWRSGTPLIYRAVPSWFIKVEKIRDQLLECNKETYWVPDYVKEKRFHNWLEGARDWAVSRSRFWGTPLPVWISQDGEEIVVMDSIEKLERLSGVKVNDLHRHHVDDITIPSSRGPEFGVLKRVEDVFDCWFESGSMPYAYIHYPFENRELFEKNFPGNFVAEGLDQTRGWFYTLMVLSTALFGKPAFKNLICNGLVLAEDGKKMSKSKQNYPSPMEVIDEYGADALRLCLVNSPVVRAESLRFERTGVFGVVKDVFLPWYNAYRFLVQNAKRLEVEGCAFSPIDQASLRKSSNVLDHWINSATESLVSFVRQEMDAYRLYTVVPYLVKYIDNLTNIYVRFNRKRLEGRTGEEDCKISLSTLYHALVTTCVAMAPFTPFFTEVLYQNLRKASSKSEQSIHFCSFPSTTGERDERVERNVTRMMTIIDLARNIRERHSKALKTPLKEMVVVHPDSEFLEDITGKLKEYVMEEMNVRSVTQCNDPMKYASLRAEPNFSVLGKRLGKDMGKVSNEVKKMTLEQVLAFEQSGHISFFGHCLTLDDIKVVRQFKRPVDVSEKEIDAAGDGDVLVILDLRADQSLIEAGVAREVVNRIQKLRKTAQSEPTGLINVYYEPVDKNSNTLEEILQSQDQYIRDLLGNSLLPKAAAPSDVVVICEESHTVHDMSFVIYIARCMLPSHRCRTMASSPPPNRRNPLRSCRQASALVSSCLPDAKPTVPRARATGHEYLQFGTGASAKPSPKMGDSSVEVTEESQPNARVRTEFTGVRRQASGRYTAQAKDERGRDKHLGTFNAKEQAVKARKDFVLKLELKEQLKKKKKKHPRNGILKEKEKVCIALEQKRVVSAQENSSAAEESIAESPEEEKRPLQKATCRLIKEKEDVQDMISSLREEMNRLLEQQNIFHNYMNSQQLYVMGLKTSLRLIQSDIHAFQMKWRDEISNLGSNLKCLVDAAENYPKVLAENRNLFNEVQELKGNIRVYCRVRPFLPGEDKKSTIIDYIGESGELLISNPLKQGKAGQRMFTFNKVFSSFASQADVFSDTQPLIRSVLDGFSVCILAYGQSGSGKTYTMSGTSTSKKDQGVTYRALNDLFDISLNRRNIFSYEVGVQMVEIYNEQVRDLLSNKIEQKQIEILSTSQPNGLVLPDASLYPVKSTSDVLDLMETGLGNRAVGATALNERSSRSHSILIVHVRGLDLKTGSISRGCLHLVDLAGSERVERSEATGDRLKEAQHINKSLSALGDVIFALAQKSTHVPYRNSKLTQLLKSSLGGQAKTLMFVQINPNVVSYSETISTLKFAERVSGVELGAAKSNKDGKDIKELLEQVSSLKDTISRKDMVIEELQLRKDKNKSPSSVVDNHGSSMPNNGNSNETLLITLNQKRQLPDPLIYAEVNADAGQTSPTNIVAMGLDEADYEDNVSEDGSLRETKYTIGRRNIMNCDDTKMHRGPSRIDNRSTLTKSAQPAISRSKPRGAVLKTPKSHKDPIQPVGGRLFGQGSQKMAEIEHVPAARSVICMPTATRRDVKGGNSWRVAVG